MLARILALSGPMPVMVWSCARVRGGEARCCATRRAEDEELGQADASDRPCARRGAACPGVAAPGESRWDRSDGRVRWKVGAGSTSELVTLLTKCGSLHCAATSAASVEMTQFLLCDPARGRLLVAVELLLAVLCVCAAEGDDLRAELIALLGRHEIVRVRNGLRCARMLRNDCVAEDEKAGLPVLAPRTCAMRVHRPTAAELDNDVISDTFLMICPHGCELMERFPFGRSHARLRSVIPPSW